MMRMIAKFALSCVAALAVVDCAATWQSMSEARSIEAFDSSITVGKTTKADLDTALGQATAISLDSGYDVWVYKNEEKTAGLARYLPLVGTTAFFSPPRKREVVVLFHPDGVVKKYRIKRYRG